MKAKLARKGLEEEVKKLSQINDALKTGIESLAKLNLTKIEMKKSKAEITKKKSDKKEIVIEEEKEDSERDIRDITTIKNYADVVSNSGRISQINGLSSIRGSKNISTLFSKDKEKEQNITAKPVDTTTHRNSFNKSIFLSPTKGDEIKLIPPPVTERKLIKNVRQSVKNYSINFSSFDSNLRNSSIITRLSIPKESTDYSERNKAFQGKINQVINDSLSLKNVLNDYHSKHLPKQVEIKSKIPSLIDYNHPDKSLLEPKKATLRKNSHKLNLSPQGLKSLIEERIFKTNKAVKSGFTLRESVKENVKTNKSNQMSDTTRRKSLHRTLNSLAIFGKEKGELSKSRGSIRVNTDEAREEKYNAYNPDDLTFKKHPTSIRFKRNSLNQEIPLKKEQSSAIKKNIVKRISLVDNRLFTELRLKKHDLTVREKIPITDLYNTTTRESISPIQKSNRNSSTLAELIYTELDNEMRGKNEENERKRRVLNYLITQQEKNLPVEENLSQLKQQVSKISDNLFLYNDIITKDYTDLIDSGELIKKQIIKSSKGVIHGDYTAPKRVSLQNLKNYYPSFVKTIFKGKGIEELEDFKKWQNHKITLFKLEREKRDKKQKVLKANKESFNW